MNVCELVMMQYTLGTYKSRLSRIFYSIYIYQLCSADLQYRKKKGTEICNETFKKEKRGLLGKLYSGFTAFTIFVKGNSVKEIIKYLNYMFIFPYEFS